VPLRLVGRGAAGVDGEPGEDPGAVADLGLAVAGADADGVELEQLAAEVLVRGPLRRGGVVEVGQHRRVRGGRLEEVGEPAERVPPENVGVVAVAVVPDVVAGAGDVEVVRPDVDHHLEQLPPAPRGPAQGGPAQVEHEVPGAVGVAGADLGAAQGERGKAGDDGVALGIRDRRRVQLLLEPGAASEPGRAGDEVRREAPRGAPQQVGEAVGLAREPGHPVCVGATGRRP
jgi:hypothetical protein